MGYKKLLGIAVAAFSLITAFSACSVPSASSKTVIYVTVGETELKAELAENTSADAFKKLLEEGDLTVPMQDYGDFEKVGKIGKSLPENKEQITTAPGDIILYQGNSITIYYDTNTWNFTRLGKLQNVTETQLRALLGKGDVTVTFSLTPASSFPQPPAQQ